MVQESVQKILFESYGVFEKIEKKSENDQKQPTGYISHIPVTRFDVGAPFDVV